MKPFVKKLGTLITLLVLVSTSVLFADQKVIEFGKYDEYAFLIYERTAKIPKRDTIVSAVSIRVDKNMQCSYKLVLHMPKKVTEMAVWDIGEWRKIKQGKSLSGSTDVRSMTHILRGKEYTITGYYSTDNLGGGYIRGIYRGETMPVGNYKLDIFINEQILKTINFNVY